MKKLVLLLTLVAMLSPLAANAKTILYDFTFRNTSGTAYCDGFYVYLYGTPKTLVDGYHWSYDCAGSDAYVNGFKASVSANYQYSATGATLIVSDPAFGVTNGSVYLVNPLYNTWTLWRSGGGSGEYVFNYGTFVNFTHADKKGTKSSGAR